jgi:hypothetical protein
VEILVSSGIFKPCSSVDIHRYFRGKYRLNLQCKGVSRTRDYQYTDMRQSDKFIADLLLRLPLNPEDGGDIFLQIVGGRLLNYTA